MHSYSFFCTLSALFVLGCAAPTDKDCACPDVKPGYIYQSTLNEETGCISVSAPVQCEGHDDEYCLKSAAKCSECDGLWLTMHLFKDSSPCHSCRVKAEGVPWMKDNVSCCRNPKKRNLCNMKGLDKLCC